MHKIFAIFIKEWLHIRRDRLTLAMMFMIPVMQLTLFGFAINMDVQHMKTIIWDQDQRQASRELIKNFTNTGYFDQVATAHSEHEVTQALLMGKAWVGLIIPPDYSRKLLRNQPADVLVLVDGSNSTVANQALNLSRSIGQLNSIKVLQERMRRVLGSGASFREAVEIRPKTLFNPELKSRNFMIPGLLGVIMQLVTVMLTAFSIVREREKGTLEQLIVTPVNPAQVILGKLSPYFLIGLLNMLMVIGLMVFLFGVPIAGSLALLMGLSVFFILASLGIGLLISTVSQNQVQALQFTLLVFLPSMMLSGFIFPRESMPWLISSLGLLIPLTYFVEILRGIVLRGVGLEALWQHVIPVILFGLVLIVVSVLRFRRSLA
ncbi:ABC transporter permease [bacterium (Candidatus Blackallbacteria) CG17_big_fil_post_rev_8_21_14_2_50_48_46]|uniref:Transport permease protein n=1 Tax=bacterium (Candidatus Blackallbacteria) CG17_big_fil_post_rev_8_21_14_2_50_48_46 TaxID=2014261 RepID=A0A2M7G512_9BACT|nr:MAG: transporter [bacterium (Candidatus Blackallbacteria) CG18_big_fil_WC_8_21_14_2_50_49_26]PIW16624.1 MAG: ABC transporter permease [bacterium (Candidatus Blackallbacteria) CG17_big_fil_post_rev_8_21_14_2_50_48_46]PIW46132.1 MAG: ABC transporter permease [bacterium (Candidatus Blackallbacteria) CG13_big_fil_rev_8_21_14_2_50_49_14]